MKDNLSNRIPFSSPLPEIAAGLTHTEGTRVKCEICFRRCVLGPGETAPCGSRQNRNGRPRLPPGYPVSVYAKVPRKHLDPDTPNNDTSVLVVGGYGCNLLCGHCINGSYARQHPSASTKCIDPSKLPQMARRRKARAVAFAVNEPTVHLDHLLTNLIGLRQEGLPGILCTNGVFTGEALKLLLPFLDSFVVSLKGLSEKAYETLTGERVYNRVLENLKALRSAEKNVSIVYVPVPGWGDSLHRIGREVRRLADEAGLSGVRVTILRFIPAGILRHESPAGQIWLTKVVRAFEKARFWTTVREA